MEARDGETVSLSSGHCVKLSQMLADELLVDVRRSRRALPAEHRALLDQLGVQETVIDDWPQGVQDLYRTIGEPEPAGSAARVGAAAVWLDARRTVAFNGALVPAMLRGLTAEARTAAVSALAWHEYGHALSATRATSEQKKDGLRLLELLTPALRAAIAYPGGYRAWEVFDEIIATVYALMVGRVRAGVYVPPEYLHSDVYQAFQEVIPWPPTN